MLTGTLVTIFGFLPIGFADNNTGQYCFSLFAVIAVALIASWFVAVIFAPVIGLAVLPSHMKAHQRGRARPLHARLRPGARVGHAAPLAHHRRLARRLRRFRLRPGLRAAAVLPGFEPAGAPGDDDPAEERLDRGDRGADGAAGEGRLRAIPTSPASPPMSAAALSASICRSTCSSTTTSWPRPWSSPRTSKPATGCRPSSSRCSPTSFPDVTARISRLELGPPVGWPVQYRVSAPTTEEARHYAEQVANVLRASGLVRNVNYDWAEKSKELRIVVDQDRVRQAGLSSEQLAQALNRVISGSTVTQVRDSIYLVDVVARAESGERSSIEALRNLQITTPTGASVPLRELATFQYELDEGYVWRRGRLPTITVQAEPLPGAGAGLREPAHQRRAREPCARRCRRARCSKIGGTVEKSDQSNAALLAQVPLMIALMLTVLMVQLGSFRRLALVISVAPLGLIGVVAALLITGTPMGFIATLGIIALAGMIIRNSVILVDQIEHERAQGVDPWEAVIDATKHRFRPIMLTAAAAILGMIPIMHDVFWGPMAYAIVGGLAVATVLTLVFLPALYVAVNGIREKNEPEAAPDVAATCSLAAQN